MAFYKDRDWAIWQDGRNGVLYCIHDPIADPFDDESELGLPSPKRDVEKSFGPLEEVISLGWEVVKSAD